MRLAEGTTFRVAAVLLDMDGTVVDSTTAVRLTWQHWAARHGLDAAAIVDVAHGVQAADTIRRFTPAGIDIDAEIAWQAARELGETEGIAPVPGAARFLESLPPDRWAIVTSADRALATFRMTLAGLPLPAVMVTAEDVARGKPDPEGFRLAARRLGAGASPVLVFEDSPSGLAAGHASGFETIAVAATRPAAPAERWLPDFTSLVVDPPSADGTIVLRVAGQAD